jgi:hypothetical protein
VDQPRQISPPHPLEHLQQGLDEGDVAGFYSIMPTSQEKINWLTQQNYFNFLPPLNF